MTTMNNNDTFDPNFDLANLDPREGFGFVPDSDDHNDLPDCDPNDPDNYDGEVAYPDELCNADTLFDDDEEHEPTLELSDEERRRILNDGEGFGFDDEESSDEGEGYDDYWFGRD